MNLSSVRLLKEFRIRHRIRSEPPAEIVVRFPAMECLPLEYICRIFHEKNVEEFVIIFHSKW